MLDEGSTWCCTEEYTWEHVRRDEHGYSVRYAAAAARLVEKNQGREQAGTRNGSWEGWWNTGLVDEHGKRERGQSIVHRQLFTLKDGDNLRAPLQVHPPYKTGAMSNSYMMVGDEVSVAGGSPASTLTETVKPDEGAL